MYLIYGTYVHGFAECDLSTSREPLFNDQGFHYGFHVSWTVNGILQAADSVSLGLAILAMEAAYATQFQTVGLYYDATGATPTAHVLSNATTLGGVKVSGPNWAEGPGEYTNKRTYTLRFEAETPQTNTQDRTPGEDGPVILTRFTETVSITGTGGPRKVMFEPLEGDPIEQQVTEKTAWKARQSGSATAYRGYPKFPDPLWPENELEDQRQRDRVSPERVQGQSGKPDYQEYTVTWAYQFQSVSRLEKRPHLDTSRTQ